MQSSSKSKNRNKVLKWTGLILVCVAVYFGNRAVQTHFGEQALTNIEFEVLELNVALAKAQAHDKLVLADMSAIWCPTCRKLDSTVFSAPNVKQAIEDNFVFARVEYDSEQGAKFMQDYQVSGFPVLLVLSSEGKKLTRLPLTFDNHEFVGNLNQVLALR
jgi:thiol:disulfide interchange protein